MSNDHKLLWQQVQNLARDDRMVARARDSLSGLFEAAQRGKFELASHYQADPSSLAKALATALRRQPIKVVTVSIDDRKPLDADELAAGEIFSLDQGFKLGSSFWEALRFKYHWTWQEAFRQGPGEAARLRLERALLFTFGRPLETAVWKTLESSCRWKRQRARIYDGIWDCVLLYLGFIALGDKDRAGRLEPLVRLLPRYFFYCARDEDLASWLVLMG